MTIQIFNRKYEMKSIICSSLTFLLLTCIFSRTSTSSYAVDSTRNSVRSQMQENRMEMGKTKAMQEIDRRITSLNELITRIQAMKRISDAQKSSLVSDAQSQINSLTTLKTKIQADTDPATIKTDRQSIYSQYRIYMLFMPKIRILAAADRMNEIVDVMSQTATNLETRINSAKTAGKNVANLETALADLKAKLTDAKTQYTNAQNTVTGLTPDNEDSTKMQSNKTALENARAMIKTGSQDLKIGRTDIETIRQGLKDMKLPEASTIK